MEMGKALGDPHTKQTGMFVVLLRVFWAKHEHFNTLGLHVNKWRKINYILVFVVSFGHHRKLESRPDWSPLGFYFKISITFPSLFHMGIPPLPVRMLDTSSVVLVNNPLKKISQNSLLYEPAKISWIPAQNKATSACCAIAISKRCQPLAKTLG